MIDYESNDASRGGNGRWNGSEHRAAGIERWSRMTLDEILEAQEEMAERVEALGDTA
ncbi:MAG: hypothetical protein HY760_04445 [Nitrospirae bacterium]|nr:hypothetical protein [Nitrospirota bacterium]